MVALIPTKQMYPSYEQRIPREQNKKSKKSYFDQIPNELISSIIACVASSSIIDLSNAKLSCKSLKNICNDGYILKHATLEEFPIILWSKQESKLSSHVSFFELCQQNGNPEALYRKGILDYFNGGSRDHALEYLRRANEYGHLGASYAIGMILILTGEKHKGIQHLGPLKKDKNLTREIAECRDKFKRIIGSMWSIHNDQIVKEVPTCCSLKYQHRYKRGWSLEDDEKDIECEACLCDNEVDCICEFFIRKIM